MSSQRQEAFKRGILAFRANSFVDAVRHFDQALDQAANEVPLQIKILDSRAATKAKLQDFKAALADAKRIIDLCPEISKGYIRAARLFREIGKYTASIQMYNRALSRTHTDDPTPESTSMYQRLVKEREDVQVLVADQANTVQQKLAKNSVGRLPFELFVHVVSFLDDTARLTCVRVCSSWRSVIYRTPKLWTTLTLTPQTKKPTARLNYWLSRLGLTHALEALTIQFNEAWPLSEMFALLENLIKHCGSGSLPSTPQVKLTTFVLIEDALTRDLHGWPQLLKKLFEFLLLSATTLVSIDIIFSPAIRFPNSLSAVLSQFPQLKRLRMLAGKRPQSQVVVPDDAIPDIVATTTSANQTGSTDHHQISIPGSSSAENSSYSFSMLEGLALQGIIFDQDFSQKIRLDSLRHLSFPGQCDLPQRAQRYTAFINLAQIDRLEQLVVGSSNPQENSDTHIDTNWSGCSSLSNLKHLSLHRTVQPLSHFIRLAHPDPLSRMLAPPIAPELRCLVLTDIHPATAYEFLGIYAHEFRQLDSLSLSGVALTSQTEPRLIQALADLPPLIHLCLRRTNASSTVVKAIKPEKLVHLDLVDCVRVSISPVAALVSGSVPVLDHLDVTGCDLICTRENVNWLRGRIASVKWQTSGLKSKAKYVKRLRLD